MKSTKRKFFVGIILLSIFFILAILALTKTNDYVVYAAASTDVIEEDPSAENKQDYNVRLIDSQVEAQFSFVKLNDTECSVRLSNKTEATKAIIPSTAKIDGKRYKVTEVYNSGFSSATKLERVKLPSTVKKIGNSAFYNCPKLETVSLGNTEEIGNSAFSKCPKLIEINIPESVIKMGSTVFRNDSTKVYINAGDYPDNWSSTWNRYNSEKEKLGRKHKAKKEYEVLTNPLARTSDSYIGAVVASGQPVEGYYTFDVDIGGDAISCYEVPAQIEFEGKPIDVIAIDNGAFSDIDVDVLVNYSSSSISISSGAFEGYKGKTVYFNRNIDFVNFMENENSEAIFRDADVQTVVLPNTLNRLVNSMFENCKILNNIYFCDISTQLMNYEDAIVTLESSLNELILNKINEENEKEDIDRDNLWGELESINSIVILGGEFNGITEIGEAVFAGTTSIDALHLFDNITKIGFNAVSGWNNEQIIRVHNNSKIIFGVDNWDEEWCTADNLLYQNRFYSITFDTSGGKLPEDFVITVKNGNPDKNLPVPDYPHHDLVEWVDSGGNNWYDKDSDNKFINNKLWNEQYDKSISIPDIKLTARWGDHIYTVTLDKNGGDGEPDILSLKYGEKYGFFDKDGKILTPPTKPNHTFTGYSTVNNIYVYDENMRPLNDMKFEESQDITLYANWEIQSTTVTLVRNNDTGDTDIIKAVLGKDMPLTDTEGNRLKVPEKEGHQFIGYFYDGDNEPYYIADKNEEYLISDRKYVSDIIILSAKWEAKSYEIILDANGGVGGSIKVKVTYDSLCPNEAENDQKYIAPTKRGYKFTGYYADDDNEPYYGSDGNFLIGKRKFNNLNVTKLTAHWDLIKYTLNYGDFEKLIDEKYKEYTVLEDFDFPLIINDDGGKISWTISNTSDLNLDEADVNNQIAIKGKLVEIETEIVYNKEGGYEKAGNFPDRVKYSDNIELGYLYKPGYKFEGWYNGEEEIYALTHRKEEKITLTAKWSRRVNTNPEVQIPNGSTYYKIVTNGAYILPQKNFNVVLHIEIMSGANEVYLFSSLNYVQSYSMYITIHTEQNASFNLHLDNFQINAPIIDLDGNKCPQSAIYVHTKNTVPVWKGVNTPSSIPINPVVPGFNPPIVPGPTYPTIIPTVNSVGDDIVTYSTQSTNNYGGRLNLYAYNEVGIYGGSGKNGTSTNKDGGNGACAIYCENFTIKYADNLYIRGGDAGRSYGKGTEGTPAYGIVCVYSIDEWFDSYTGEPISFDIHQVTVHGGCASNLCYGSYYVIGPPQISLPSLI